MPFYDLHRLTPLRPPAPPPPPTPTSKFEQCKWEVTIYNKIIYYYRKTNNVQENNACEEEKKIIKQIFKSTAGQTQRQSSNKPVLITLPAHICPSPHTPLHKTSIEFTVYYTVCTYKYTASYLSFYWKCLHFKKNFKQTNKTKQQKVYI